MAEPESPSDAARSATKLHRSSPLRGLWQHAPPYFHDGSAATLENVGRLYNTRRALGLSAQQVSDLAQHLESLQAGPVGRAASTERAGARCGATRRARV